mmetsp:Transcript_30983/g.54352  ORF Transcript_30983/g.54352 Transcript_30983/m.54352 type:complete len:264 (-) Transcript_30983:779-1570(-)
MPQGGLALWGRSILYLEQQLHDLAFILFCGRQRLFVHVLQKLREVLVVLGFSERQLGGRWRHIEFLGFLFRHLIRHSAHRSRSHHQSSRGSSNRLVALWRFHNRVSLFGQHFVELGIRERPVSSIQFSLETHILVQFGGHRYGCGHVDRPNWSGPGCHSRSSVHRLVDVGRLIPSRFLGPWGRSSRSRTEAMCGSASWGLTGGGIPAALPTRWSLTASRGGSSRSCIPPLRCARRSASRSRVPPRPARRSSTRSRIPLLARTC